MTLRDRRGGLLVLVILVFVSLVGAAGPLNPLVVRTDARAPVPAECDEGLSPTAPLRADYRDIPLPEAEPAEAVAPPSSELRSALQQTQNALARNDRPAFDEALARTRALLAGYPPGGESRAAQDVHRIHEAAGRLWDAQYRSPFFGEASPEYALVNAYPGWSEAVRRATWTDASGQRFYPAAESRDFLGRLAAERLQTLGIRSTTRIARAERPAVDNDDVARPLPNVRPRTTTTRRSTVSSGTTTTPTTRPSRSASRSTPRTSTSRSRATRPPAAATATPAPRVAAPPAAAAVPADADLPPATAAPPAGAAAGAPDTATGAADPAALDDDPATTTPAGTATTDTAIAAAPTETTETTATRADPATPATDRTRSVILPTILILIGLGVLIVLFRASK